jgi:hypothetical protein
MADQNIKVRIDLDIAEFNKNIKQLSDAISKVLGREIQLVNANLEKTAQVAQKAGDAMGRAGRTVTTTGGELKKSNMQWTSLALIVQDLPYGFRAIQNNLPALIGSFAGVGGAAYLAFSAIIAGFTFYDEAKRKSAAETKKLKETEDEYAKSLTQSTSNAYTEISAMKSLVEIAGNSNEAMSKRLIAVDNLQKEYPAYFGNLTKEQILNGNVAESTYEVANAIIARARARAMEERVGKLTAEQLDAESNRITLQKENNTLTNEKIKLLDENNGAERDALSIGSDMRLLDESAAASKIRLNEIDAQIIANKAKIEAFSITEQKNAYEALTIQRKLNSVKSEGLKLDQNKPTKVKQDKVKEPKDEKVYYLNILQYAKDYYDIKTKYALDDLELQRTILKEEQGTYDALFALKLISDIEYAKRSADIYKQLFDIKKKQDDELYKSQVYFSDQRIKNIESRLALELKLNRNNIIGQKDAIKRAMAETGILAASALNPTALQNFLSFFDQLDYKLKATNEQWNSFSQNISSTISGFLADSLISLAENIGNALSGGEVKPLEHFQKLLAEALINIGKMLIQYGTMMQIAFAAPDPFVAIAAGVAAVALGTIIKNRLKQSAVEPTAFANGGIVSGPTMGLMGEYPGAQNNPEVIAPLDKLKDLIGGGGSGQFVLRGQDLVLAMQRSNSSLNIRRG